MRSSSRPHKSRGAVSLTFVAALAVGVVSLMMVLNARTLMTLSMVSRSENSEKANAQAVAVIEETKSKILADRNFGKNGEVVVVGDLDSEEWAQVSFAPGSDFTSLNNLGESGQLAGEGGVMLDPGMIQVVAVSQYRDQKVVSYEIVMAPPLPFSLGSSGAVVAGGNSVIGGVESAGVLVDGLDRSQELVDGGVVANGMTSSAGVTTPLTLKDNVELVGKAKYQGGEPDIDLATVNLDRGKLEKLSAPEELPQIDPTRYDPASERNNWKHVTRTGATVDTNGVQVVTDTAPVYGFHRFADSVRFDAPLNLNGGLVFVNGDVTLTKPLTGSGALVATGKVTITGGADIKADALAAVVAGGDLTVVGQGKDAKSGQMSSRFTGLLYSGGNLTLTDTRTVGSAIAAGTASGGSVMTIQDSEFLASPEGQDVSIVIQDGPDAGTVGMGGMSGDRSGDIDYIIEPTAAAIMEDPSFRSGGSADQLARHLLRIRYENTTYKVPTELLGQVPDQIFTTIDDAYRDAMDRVKIKIEKLRAQGESLQTVKFDLNEFLNTSARLKASRPYYIKD